MGLPYNQLYDAPWRYLSDPCFGMVDSADHRKLEHFHQGR